MSNGKPEDLVRILSGRGVHIIYGSSEGRKFFRERIAPNIKICELHSRVGIAAWIECDIQSCYCDEMGKDLKLEFPPSVRGTMVIDTISHFLENIQTHYMELAAKKHPYRTPPMRYFTLSKNKKDKLLRKIGQYSLSHPVILLVDYKERSLMPVLYPLFRLKVYTNSIAEIDDTQVLVKKPTDKLYNAPLLFLSDYKVDGHYYESKERKDEDKSN